VQLHGIIAGTLHLEALRVAMAGQKDGKNHVAESPAPPRRRVRGITNAGGP
jgi:hypothetical protein